MIQLQSKATVSDDHKLRLELDIPNEVPIGEADVTVVVKPTRKPNKEKMLEALRGLQALGGVKSIPDPVAWQREERSDRPLPGRD